MLTVYQKIYGNSNLKVIGDFGSFKSVYEYFKHTRLYGYVGIESIFSHNSDETYRKETTWGMSVPVYCFVIENHKGLRYSREFIVNEFKKYQKKYRYYNYFNGGKRHPRGHYHRHPHTLQEIKASAHVLMEECEPIWRASRNHHNLPDSYDDINHYDDYNRNWKRYRKQQWK
jgi:hypothetical protein